MHRRGRSRAPARDRVRRAGRKRVQGALSAHTTEDRAIEPSAHRRKGSSPMVSSRSAALVPVERISRSILVLRGQKIPLDAERAALYGVTTKRLHGQVKRNAERFPDDFLFRLRSDEVEALNRSHCAAGPKSTATHASHRMLLPSTGRSWPPPSSIAVAPS